MATTKKSGSRRKRTGTIDVEIAQPKSGHVACKVTPNRYGIRVRCARVPASERDSALGALTDEEEMDDLLEEQEDDEGDDDAASTDADEEEEGAEAAPEDDPKK
jgi:hypothetical protein